MRIRVRQSRRRMDRVTLNLTSMIDVTFLLLIYFLITTVLAQQEDRLSPTLGVEREEATGNVSDFQPQIVHVEQRDGEPMYRLGMRQLRSRDELHDAIKRLPKDQGIFIAVSDNVPVGFAVAAIQVARDVGFEQVTYVPAGGAQ